MTSVDVGRMVDASTKTSARTTVTVGVDFEEFYRRSYSGIANALSMTLGDPDLGADAADEAMARTYPRWDIVQRLDKPEAWVYRVGLNWANSLRRKLARRLPFRAHTSTQPEQPVDPALEEALAELNVEMRAVIVCRFLLDWSIEETASALRIRKGTVKSRSSRALNILAARLQHMKQEGF